MYVIHPQDRKELCKYLDSELSKVAGKYGERVLHTPHNPISMAMTLTRPEGDDGKALTELGSMLFTRCVSGARCVIDQMLSLKVLGKTVGR